MEVILKIIPIILYFIAGVISMVMAFKTLFSVKFLPFHEVAAHVLWADVGDPLKQVILSLTRLAGLGFVFSIIKVPQKSKGTYSEKA